MDAIFRGILLSNYSPDFKKVLLQKTVLQAADKPEIQQPYACHGIFHTIFEVVGKCNEQTDMELAYQVFRVWVDHHTDHLREFLTDDIRSSYLKNEKYTNKLALLFLINETLQRTVSDTAKVAEVVQAHTVDLMERDNMLDFAVPLTRMWDSITSPSFSGTSMVPLTKVMIRSLSRCHWPADQKTVLPFVQNVQKVSSFIGMLWNKMSAVDVKMCLMEIHAILSSEDDEPNKFICLASLVPYVETNYLEEMVKSMILDNGSSSTMLQKVLGRVIDWLRWPTKNVDQVVISIMKMLESAKHYSVLIQVTRAKIEQIFSYLNSKSLRDAALPVILYMLLSYQHSPDVFHKLVIHIPDLVKKLIEENSETSKKILSHVVEIVHLLMQFHSGFPDLYDPIFQALQNFPPPDIAAMKNFMAQRKWGSNKRNYASSSLPSPSRSETGKTGLINLGNTCYMNSVLQALFMNDEFRTCVLNSPPCQHQVFLLKLQEVFAFLLHTKRAAYSPKNFFEASRPSWFEPGHQQDCSEFLRYLFDSMHEQECPKQLGGTASSEKQDIETNVEYCTTSAISQTQSFQCLIHKLFGGELTVSYKCLHCHQVSVQKENFIDLSLALPECHNDAKYIQRRELKAGRAEENMDMTRVECASLLDLGSSDQVLNAPATSSADDLKLEDLINHYISPEKLEGENSYHCSNCNALREAQKTIGISAAPKYLTLTLLRFAYDIQTHQRVKILRNVMYPEVLTIPVASAADKHGETASGKCSYTYVLHAVVVHSGVSSDCGHYYAYARNSDVACQSAFRHGSGTQAWNLFNDSRVSFSVYESFAKLSQRFAHDTAYLLFYCRVTPENSAPESSTKDENIRADLLDTVWSDNLAYAQELEEEEAKKEKIAATVSTFNSYRKDFDDRQPPGSCGDGSGGFGSFSATFVC